MSIMDFNLSQDFCACILLSRGSYEHLILNLVSLALLSGLFKNLCIILHQNENNNLLSAKIRHLVDIEIIPM